MSVNTEKYGSLISELKGKAVLVAVSKTKPVSDILELYELGQRDFGENYVQELVEKEAVLPKDIRWHFIGHLQSNKVKYIAPFVHLIHGADSPGLLKEINRQAAIHNRVINCLLQIHIAKEASKFGFSEPELDDLETLNGLQHLHISGMMGMASFTDDVNIVRSEFASLRSLFVAKARLPKFNRGVTGQTPRNTEFTILSMGMSGDYPIALEEGSNMVRIGSLLFGERNYTG